MIGSFQCRWPARQRRRIRSWGRPPRSPRRDRWLQQTRLACADALHRTGHPMPKEVVVNNDQPGRCPVRWRSGGDRRCADDGGGLGSRDEQAGQGMRERVARIGPDGAWRPCGIQRPSSWWRQWPSVPGYVCPVSGAMISAMSSAGDGLGWRLAKARRRIAKASRWLGFPCSAISSASRRAAS